MKLYIIGNGFDKAHNLKTSYWDFRCYLEKNAETFLIEFEKLYGHYPYDPDEVHIPIDKKESVMEQRKDILYNTLWRSFELSLGEPVESEFDTICDTAIDQMEELESGPIGIEDTLNAFFEGQFGFVMDLQDHLFKWAKQVELKGATVKKDGIKKNADLFLTFNYTATLEYVYGIDSSNICHIHGGVPPYCNNNPIIGHGNTDSIQQWNRLKSENDSVFDEGGASKCAAIANFYKRTLKDTEMILAGNHDFFNRMNGVDEVIVIGHSMGEVDLPYFRKVVDVSGNSIPWTVLYYSNSEKSSLENTVKGLGVKNIMMKFSGDYWDR